MLSAASCATAPSDRRFADADGHRIAYRVLGAGEPTIVMISGLGDGMASFADVTADLASSTTVIVYDRAGYGGSAMTPGAHDAGAAERELSALLLQSGARGPYVIVGHSVGGLYAEYFAAQHPDAVSAIVLVEARPADFTARCEDAGISPCSLPGSMAWTLPEGGRAELSALPRTSEEVERANTTRDLPALILSRPLPRSPTAFDALWSTAQRDLAEHYPGARHLIADAGGHYVHHDNRAWFVETLRAFITEQRAQR